jgi:hypothetical protein
MIIKCKLNYYSQLNGLVSKETTKTESIAEYKSTEEDFSKMYDIHRK